MRMQICFFGPRYPLVAGISRLLESAASVWQVHTCSVCGLRGRTIPLRAGETTIDIVLQVILELGFSVFFGNFSGVLLQEVDFFTFALKKRERWKERRKG